MGNGRFGKETFKGLRGGKTRVRGRFAGFSPGRTRVGKLGHLQRWEEGR